MKPLLNLDEPVQRRTGEPAEIIKRNALGDFPVIALLTHSDGRSQYPQTFTLRGSYTSDNHASGSDLINVPKPPTIRKVKLWLAVSQVDRLWISQDRPPLLSEGWKSVKEFNLEIEVP